ncbi:protein-PII uridylyltransferase [Bdellovibrio bacteriovorus]|uniref:Protein-PII uridylyltransferase n=1 Tax=Bdellovibrio bacteriovorus TaxID=959 RepID=A0A150WK31_BDEBC|nr:HD domain-containing protein [Bdellovibrio bacteriovorus]KYG63983.1 protein-PII uridylyltransferase [Bdellovibrio bacteriovorus]
MAQKSFLSSEQWQQAQDLLTPPLMTPDGNVRQVFSFSSENFSNWLGQRLEDRVKASPHWEKAQPIILGSWARGELSPKSDIDILFCGSEADVKACSDELHEAGLKLRYRMPQNPDDWTENVQAFDILALLKARPTTPDSARKLYEQQKKIWSRKKHYRQILLKAVKDERKSRAGRYDSITNYLEPNIKYGPGGLRDLEQGLQIYELFAEKFMHPGHALNVLNYYRHYFLNLRHKLQLEGYGDILTGAVQFDIGQWMGFKSHKDFMRSLQRGLSRVHFYSDWIVEVAESSEKELRAIENKRFKKLEDLSLALHNDSSVLMQKKVRENIDTFIPDSKAKILAKKRGLILEKALDVKADDSTIISFFRSRLMDKLVPEMGRLVGYVQHDQYHRFTADSHIMQACREVKRIFKKPKELGPLQPLHKKLSKEDWKILSWSCLYHDLAKGLESSEHHSDLGVEIVARDFQSYGFSKAFITEVQWMVQNHLELSQAAFRKNAKDPKVWQDLRNKGAEGARLYRLALFTAIDIRATNPEAWNEWKAKLLKDLVVSLESKKAQNFFDFEKTLAKKKLKMSAEVMEELGPVLLENIGIEDLVSDLKKTETSEDSLKPWVYAPKKGDVWIRFHHKKDRQGLLSDYVGQLFSLGLGIKHASIHTLPKVGVYDWFQVSTTRNAAQLEKILAASSFPTKSVPDVKFDDIQLMSADENEWVYSFKAVDQSGLLASAAKSLSDLGVSIRAARVHTWGRQVDDIFIVKPQAEKTAQDVLKSLKDKFSVT